jgi:trimethylamine:corrinoid methyltransferase-like protein
MAWEDLKNCKPGAQFLTNTHTFEHCRDALAPINFIRFNRETWEGKGGADLITRATERFRALMKEAEPIAIPEAAIREMERIVKSADEHLAK